MKNIRLLKVFILLILLSNISIFAQQNLNGTWSRSKESLVNNHDPERFSENDFSWGKGKLHWLNGDISIDLNENIIAFDRYWIIRKIERLGEGKYRITYSGDYESEWEKSINIIQPDYNHLYFYNDDYEKESRDGIQTRLGEQFLWYRISAPAAIPLEYAELNDTSVRVRTEANLNCDTWGYVNKGDLVIIKDKSNEKYNIDGENWYWYKVESKYLPDGWIYGKYLNKITKEDFKEKMEIKNPYVQEKKLSRLEIIEKIYDAKAALKGDAFRNRQDKKNVVHEDLKKIYIYKGNKYEGKKDTLILINNEYSYIHGLKIGMSKNELLDLLGIPDEERENKIIYKENYGKLWKYTLMLHMKNEFLEKIELVREDF